MTYLESKIAPRLSSMVRAKAKALPTRDSLNIQLVPKHWIRAINRTQYLSTVVGLPNLVSAIHNTMAEGEQLNRLCLLIENRRQNP